MSTANMLSSRNVTSSEQGTGNVNVESSGLLGLFVRDKDDRNNGGEGTDEEEDIKGSNGSASELLKQVRFQGLEVSLEGGEGTMFNSHYHDPHANSFYYYPVLLEHGRPPIR